jgi:hypothetical protein
VGRFWWPTSFDATLGFPGEGPLAQSLRAPLATPPQGDWLHRAARVLTGSEALGGQPWIADDLSDDAIHDVLLKIAVRGNSTQPIAARFQLHPSRVGRLLGLDDATTIQAAQGCAYTFHQRPYQFRRPRPIRLAAAQLAPQGPRSID